MIAHCSFRQPVLRLSVLAFRHTTRTCLCGRAACMTSAVSADQFHPPFTGPIQQAALISLLLWWTQGFACTTRSLPRLLALFTLPGLTIVARIPKFFIRRHFLYMSTSRLPLFHPAALLDSLRRSLPDLQIQTTHHEALCVLVQTLFLNLPPRSSHMESCYFSRLIPWKPFIRHAGGLRPSLLLQVDFSECAHHLDSIWRSSDVLAHALTDYISPRLSASVQNTLLELTFAVMPCARTAVIN